METAKTICKIRAIYTPLQDRICKYGDTFKKVAHNEANGMYCYKRTPNSRGKPVYYEVFKARKAKDETGNTYDRYPSSSDFGFGVALCICGDCEHITEKIDYINDL